MSVFAAHAFVAAAVLAFSAPLGFLLFLLAIAVVAALLAALTALLVLLALTGIVAGLLTAPLLALVLLTLVLLTLVLLTLADILLLLPAILLDSTGVGFALLAAALLTLLGLSAAVLIGTALLWLTIFLLICHDQSPWLDAKETRVQRPLFLRREIDRPEFSIFLTWIMKTSARPSREPLASRTATRTDPQTRGAN